MTSALATGRRAQRALRATQRHPGALIRAPLLLALVSRRLGRHGYRPTVDWLDGRATKARRFRPADPEAEALELALLVRLAARLVPDATCLRRALVLRHLLAGAGIAAAVRLGVRPGPGDGLDFHAWVTVQDRVVSEPERMVDAYVVLHTGNPPAGAAL